MNDYIRVLKSNVEKFYNSRLALETGIERDRKMYTTDFLAQKENDYRVKKAALIDAFIEQCQKDFNEIKGVISKASFVNVSTTQSDVFKMFSEGNIELRMDEVNVYLEKANKEHDFTMLRAIEKYGKSNNLVLNIKSPEMIVDAYKTFFEGAINLAISSNNNFDVSSETVFQAFADDEFCEGLHDTIGNCLFPNQSFSDEYSHSFDNIKLSTPNCLPEIV